MRAQSFVVLASLSLGALHAACSSPTGSDVLVRPIEVDRVDVRVGQTFPALVSAHVQGLLGDGCASFHSLRQDRSANTITLTILGQRPREAVCIQIAQIYDADIPLEGQYASGRYVLRVNGVESTFTTP